ncbi:conjugal transfer protein TrbH [Rhizobium sp. ARZ01]|uniref:conjugal transfer protein TrbH n=1 Tax=Rhizobium sp. ARZ01 TaxID=2769313 RepID=UPI00177CAECA|nr:conjugal transfer protein TrbH [Rhizobium sp. ARZ01]MBD9375501.1 conjugal transfer protein TrbH [Rhizobium sp. ARZ01]
MRELLCLLFTVTIVSGCQTADEIAATLPSAEVAGPVASAIAGDMATKFAEQIGPADVTAIKMDKDGSEYANALQAALKGWGYNVITDGKVEKEEKAIELTYAIDDTEGEVLARLTTPSIALGRVYTPTTTGATPSSPLSVMQLN